MKDYNNVYKGEIIDIVDSLKKGHFSVFCGAGATADSTGVTWKDLFKKALSVLDKDVTDYYRLAEYYKLQYGRNKLITEVSSAFSKINSSKHIEHLLNLPMFSYWTTNFDCIIEQMISSKTNVIPSVIYDSKNVIKLNEDKRYKVFKMNGSITDGDSMVLTSSDYEAYKFTQKPLVEFLKRELVLNTFLFVGYSFDDNLVLSCLSENKKHFPSLDNYHYRIEKKQLDHSNFQEIEKKYFEENYNIKTIFVDTYDEIDELIDFLHLEYKKNNVYISGSFRNLSVKEENYANDLCKEIVEKLFAQDLTIHSGDGKRLGSYIITNATKHLMNNNGFIQNKLKIMPYIDHSFKSKQANHVDRVKLIDEMIADSSVSIFMYGQSEDGGVSDGVMQEYYQSREQGKILIPIPTTGYAAEAIFNDMKERGLPGYLEKYDCILANEKDIEKLVKTVLEIINISTM